ncbi:MAG: N-acetylmuramoyl-L-alanine amidase [Clostridiales bacterium]|nr:N-acetylmuramoyl-L-alanine amidase [Clostridiales bacterium]
MKIIYPQYQWAYALTPRKQTTHLILHHSATSSATTENIHAYHKSLGWAGIAYHFLVRKNGAVYAGRPIDMMGGHTKNYNHCSIGVCFEGNFDKEYMPDAQLESGQELISYLLTKYPSIITGQHKDFGKTNCAGANFPFTLLLNPSDEGDADEENKEPSEWAKTACGWAVGKGLFKGDGTGNFRWHEYATREELAAVLMRYSTIEKGGLK